MTDLARDVESYARLYDDVLDNPKLANLGPLCFAMYCAGLVYCHRNNTDGFIPHGRVAGLLDWSGVHVDTKNRAGIPAPIPHGRLVSGGGDYAAPGPIVDALVDAELWHKAAGGWSIHDYLRHNASRAERQAKREAQSRGGRIGAEKRWGTPPLPPHEVTHRSTNGSTDKSTDGLSHDPQYDNGLTHRSPQWVDDRLAMAKDKVKGKDELVGVNPNQTLSLIPLDEIASQNGGKRLSKRDVAQFVFEVWKRSAGKTDHMEFTAKRERLVTQWIGKYPPRDLFDAAIGWKFDGFSRGENDRGRPFNDFELIFRDALHVERFRDFARGAHEPMTGADEWLAEVRQRAADMTVDAEGETIDG